MAKSCMSMKLKTKLYQKCLSNAFKIFISEGFRGLYRISKKNKRKLNRFFKAADEVENMDFLRLSSIGLNNLWNYTFTKKDQQKIIKSYNLIRLEKHKPYSFSSIPSFYIYNSVYNLDIKKLELLYRRGYTNMKSLRIFNPNNQKFLSDPELYEILYENYGNYKN